MRGYWAGVIVVGGALVFLPACSDKGNGRANDGHGGSSGSAGAGGANPGSGGTGAAVGGIGGGGGSAGTARTGGSGGSAGAESCTCDEATCGQPLDNCGASPCPGVCELGESCAVCLDGVTCQFTELCLGGWCLPNRARTEAYCRPTECLGTLLPPQCGSPDAPCGEDCTQADCSGRVCGPDPNSGLSCGTCEPQTLCTISGQCQLRSGIDACDGDLRTQAMTIQLEPTAGPMPAPMGGIIADGTYDLIAQHEYASDPFAEVFLRAAIRFSGGASKAEQVYDPSPEYGADYATPHRHMTVTPTGSSLHFEVTCPDTAIFPNFDRGFSVQGSELWLFQADLVEVYTRRP